MLIKGATVLDRRRVDIRAGAQIEEVGDGLVAGPGEGVLYAGGGTVLPGLYDHHVHLRSAASALDSFFVGPSPGRRSRWPRRSPGTSRLRWPPPSESS